MVTGCPTQRSFVERGSFLVPGEHRKTGRNDPTQADGGLEWATRRERRMRVIRFLVRGLSISFCSAVVGLGVGFIQGRLAWRGNTRVVTMAFAEASAVIGSEAAILVGLFLYYGVFGGRVSFETFSYVVSAACATAILCGWLLPAMGWMTMFVTIAVTIMSAVFLANHAS